MDNEYYVGAPYNFIELNKKVYEKKELQPHDLIEPQKHTGEIEYEIEAKTPIMIDDGTGRFYTNIYKKEVIPGSTMRGLVRNNMQILSFSSVADDIQNGKLMFRNVASGKEKGRYNDILGNIPNGEKGRLSVLKNVKAGYLKNIGNHYHIIPTVVDSISKETGAMNYYVLSERKIIEEKGSNFDFLTKQNPCILQHKNEPFQKSIDRNRRVHYIGTENSDYHPYFMKVSYELSGIRQVSGIDGWGRLSHNGYLISTGKMQEKKAVYIIPEMDESKEWIPLDRDEVRQDIDDFQRDYEGRKKQVEAMEGEEKGFFNLPQNGETKPVFYIQLGEKLYFGFTPRLRIFYDKEIYDGMPVVYKNVKRDYCKSLFGYTDCENNNSYKSRVCFMDAEAVKGKKAANEIPLVLGAPKPTSYLDYLTSADDKHKAVTYNDDFQLRGVKQYWLKESPDQPATVKNQKVASPFRPYDAGAVFQGKIRFENLSDEELGMLLWSLVLEKESNQNIGKAKSYGYGRIAVKLTGLNFLNYEKLYWTSGLCLKPYDGCIEKAEYYIRAAKDDMTEFLGHDVMSDTRIRHFFMMKDASKIPDKKTTQYMSIDRKDYQHRVNESIMLPTVKEVVEGKPCKHTIGKTDNNRSGKKNKGGSKGKRSQSKSAGNQESLGYLPFANINLNGDK